MAQKPDKTGQENGFIVHQSQNNTPFVQNNRYEVQTIDLQWIFKNEEHGGRSHALTPLLATIYFKTGNGGGGTGSIKIRMQISRTIAYNFLLN